MAFFAARGGSKDHFAVEPPSMAIPGGQPPRDATSSQSTAVVEGVHDEGVAEEDVEARLGAGDRREPGSWR